jgi:opacity protein-like surface antigen
MKKLLTVAAAVFLLTAITPTQAVAQKYLGQTVVGTNIGFSLVGALMSGAFNVTDRAIVGLSTRVTPGMSGTVDVGLSDRFSVGGAYFIQVATANWSSYQDTNGVTHTGDFYFRATRNNFGLRALFHFGDNDDFDPYFGVRIGMARWTFKSNVDGYEGLGLFDDTVFRNRVLPQVCFGVRYFFLPFLGVNAEIAVGFPYYLSTGINFRFGGLK